MVSFKAEVADLAPMGKPNFDLMLNSGNSTQMLIATRTVGRENMIVLLSILILDVVEYYNVNRPMTPNQITDLALEMITNFKYHTFEDIPVFFEGVKKGLYGKIYERLDASVFWECFEKYEDKRNDWITFDNSKDNNKDPIIKSESDEVRDRFTTFGDVFSQMGGRLGQIKDLNGGTNQKPK